MALVKVDRIEYLDAVTIVFEQLSTFNKNRPFRNSFVKTNNYDTVFSFRTSLLIKLFSLSSIVSFDASLK